MARLFVLFVVVLACVLLAACGVYFLGIAVWFLWTGKAAPAVFSALIAALVLYGAYLFGRVAWRTRRVSVRGERVRSLLMLGLVVAVSALAWPAPTEVRVLGVVVALIALPVWLAEEFEPPRRR